MSKKFVSEYTKIVIEKESGFYIVECAHCDGTGQGYPRYDNNSKNSKRSNQCPTCDGTGLNKIPTKQSHNLYKCSHCDGDGQAYPRYGKNSKNNKRLKQCPTCNGNGVLSLKPQRVDCNHCNGTGQKYPGTATIVKTVNDLNNAPRVPALEVTHSQT